MLRKDSINTEVGRISNGAKILFVYKGRYHVHDAVIIEYLSAISKKYEYETDLVYDQDIFGVSDNVISVPFLNRMFSNNDRIIKRILEKDPRILVFLDGFARGRWNKEISERIKGINRGIITAFLSYRDSDSRPSVYDYVLIGEPELTFEKFLTEKIFNAAKGAYKFNGLAGLNGLPLPDKKLFAPFVNFRDSYLIYTSKGCPYRCSYCEETIYKNKLGSGYFRRKAPENVILELEKAKDEFGVREVIYKDSVFTWDKSWLEDYLKEYKSKIALPYKCFGKAEAFDDELAIMLKESKCYCVEFGVQTFNERLKRDVLKRNEMTNILIKAFSICDRHRLQYDVDHLFGIPGEKPEDHIDAAKVYMKLKYINRIKCHNLAFYRDAGIYEYAPQAVKDNRDYRADFFSSVSGDKDMLKVNEIFERYYKVMPLLPRRLNIFILKNNNWKIFRFVPSIFVVLLMLVRAVKNRDRRFKVYIKYYPKKIKQALIGV